MYSIQTICDVIEGKFINPQSEAVIEHLVYDSRRIQQPSASIFFALKTEHNDGHKFIPEAYKKGLRNFIISDEIESGLLSDCNIIFVQDTLNALQKLAAFHRSHFSIPVIGITGSNGKTMIKEWLFQLLQDDFRIVRSPKSFNSQIGVPLSVWQMNAQHSLGIFEAGISRPGEMEKLDKIIKPTIGVLSNIGEAHSEGFLDIDQKIAEKVKLFSNAEILIARSKDLGGRTKLIAGNTQLMTWGHAANNEFVIVSIERIENTTHAIITYQAKELRLTIPFADHASVENAIICSLVMLVLGYDPTQIHERISKLNAIDMRLQLNHSINESLVINDSYSADITSLKIALDFLQQQSSGLTRTVILSEFFESGKSEIQLYSEIASMLNTYGIKKVIAIGEKIIDGIQNKLDKSIAFDPYLSTDDFIRDFKSSQFYKEIILIKGARKFEFERIAQLFEKKLHQTVLEINLNALANNLKAYQKILKPQTKIMAMVKAFAYGSGGAEIASVLQYHNTNYLGVAYADEGVELVKSGISLPIMIMNTEESSFQAIVDYGLQPVIYSFDLLNKFENYLHEQGLHSYPVHLEIETGMNRLGFTIDEVNDLVKRIIHSKFRIQSVFTHLAASENPDHDDFTLQQSETFIKAIEILKEKIDYPFLRHIANSAAIVRHSHLQFDMVRLGIGLYGVEIENDQLTELEPVATLRSTIAQLKRIKKGDSVSYNRKGVVKRDSLIATVRIGYADGYSRQFGNGIGRMLVKDQLAPVIGNVCMDMTMLDVTDIPVVKEGDEVIIFGPNLPVQQVALWMNTIPYEVMTGVSQRVKRVYFHE
ncbi:MAG: bifunctional UDP-N-acetylmuramoyl-tripeptide:D-alanyl-D-alanine ligase/alanine racemase [Flavisolibacter sp.]